MMGGEERCVSVHVSVERGILSGLGCERVERGAYMCMCVMV